MKKKTKGFTLVEIMIVVAIIGLLIAIALPNFMKARRKSIIRSAQASLRQIEGGYETYLLDGGTNAVDFTDVAAKISPDYVKVITACPGAGTYTFAPAAGSNLFTATITDINGGLPFTSYDIVTP